MAPKRTKPTKQPKKLKKTELIKTDCKDNANGQIDLLDCTLDVADERILDWVDESPIFSLDAQDLAVFAGAKKEHAIDAINIVNDLVLRINYAQELFNEGKYGKLKEVEETCYELLATLPHIKSELGLEQELEKRAINSEWGDNTITGLEID